MRNPATSLHEVRRAIAEKRARLQAAYEEAQRNGRKLPITREELARLDELCSVPAQPARRPAASAPTADEWMWVRC